MTAPPEWLHELANAVAAQMLAVDMLAPIGCHFCEAEGKWEVSVFASNTQIVGGKNDGVLRASRFHVDMQGVTRLFSEIDKLIWQPVTLASDAEHGPHISSEGIFAGHHVALRILARAPRRFDPGRRAIVYEHLWEEIW